MTRNYKDLDVEELARSICKEYGVNPDELIPDNEFADAPMIPRWWQHQDQAKSFLGCMRRFQISMVTGKRGKDYCEKCGGLGYIVHDAKWEPYVVKCDACPMAKTTESG